MIPKPTAYKINFDGEWQCTFDLEKIRFATNNNLQMIPLFDSTAIKDIVRNEIEVLAGQLDHDDLVALSYAEWMIAESQKL